MKALNKLAAVGSSLVLAAPAFAADPTTIPELIAAVDMSPIKLGGLAIIAVLMSIGVVLWGAKIVGSRFFPKKV